MRVPKDSFTVLAILCSIFACASCWDCGPGTQEFAEGFPEGEFVRGEERGIRTAGIPDGFYERGMSMDRRYYFVRAWNENGDLELVKCTDTDTNIEYTFYCREGRFQGREYTDRKTGRTIVRDLIHYGQDPEEFRVFCEVGVCNDWPFPFSRVSFCKDKSGIETEVSQRLCLRLSAAYSLSESEVH